MCRRSGRAWVLLSMGLAWIGEGISEVVIPKTVDGPVISWSRCGICIPKLSLEELAAWIVEAARIWDGSGVGTA